MLEAKCQTPLAKATAELMDAWALAASQPAIQTLNFWTRVLRSTLIFPGLQSSAGKGPYPRDASAARAAASRAEPQQHASTAPESGFSSYRSSGGHAVAQVIVPETN